MFRIGDQKQFWSGLFFFCLGVGTLIELPANIGTATAMGPGYFPMLLGICLILFGGTSMVIGVRATELVKAGPIPVRTMALMIAGVLVFAGLITTAGLAISLACLIVLSCLGRLRQHPFEVLVIYLVLLVLTWFIFIYVIQLPMNVFWWQ